jgi:hypothetical protein
VAEREGRRGKERPGLDVPKVVPAVVVNGDGGEKGGGERGRGTCAGEVMSYCDVDNEEREESSARCYLAVDRVGFNKVEAQRHLRLSTILLLLYTAIHSATGLTSHSIGQAFRKGRTA